MFNDRNVREMQEGIEVLGAYNGKSQVCELVDLLNSLNFDSLLCKRPTTVVFRFDISLFIDGLLTRTSTLSGILKSLLDVR